MTATVASSAACSRTSAVAAFGFLHDHLDRFTPWRDGELSVDGIQAVAELAIAADVVGSSDAVRAELERHGHDPDAWRRHVIGELVTPAFRELPRKRPHTAFLYLLPYLVLRRAGLRDDYWESTLARLAALGLPYAAEAVPYRKLDMAYFWLEAGLDVGAVEPLHVIYDRTYAALQRDPVWVDAEGAYALTHTVMYLSDFGRRAPQIPQQAIDRLVLLAESLMVHYWRSGHLDLVGELLLTVRCLGSGTQLSPLAEAYFESQRLPSGGIPGTVSRGEALQDLEPQEGEVFDACYHTTLVSLLLATTA